MAVKLTNEGIVVDCGVHITLDEAASLVDWIETEFISDIRENEYIDSVEWVANICSIWRKCCDAVKREEKSCDNSDHGG